ncbi:MAG: helix-turn-helix domain-containing protein [Mycetocola sp.]
MATETEVERLLPISTVADLFGTGRDYVYNRIKAGELPVVELGDEKPKQRIPESAVVAFVKARTFGGAS